MFAAFYSLADPVLTWLVRAAWQAGLLAAIVLVITWFMGTRLHPRWRFALWVIVFVRLAAPVLPAAPWSAFRLVSGFAPPQAAEFFGSSSAMPSRLTVVQTADRSDGFDHAHFVAGTETLSDEKSAGSQSDAAARMLAPSARTLSWARLAALVWIAGVVVLSLRFAASFIDLHRRQRHWQPITDSQALAVLQRCSSELRLARRISLYCTPDELGPATCGILRPRIILPQGLLDRLSSAELRLVFLHELVHICRQDVLVDQLVGFITILHWFHPVAWASRYFLRRERELACDAAVLNLASPKATVDYGHVILKTIETVQCAASLPGFVGMFGRGPFSLLQRRIYLIAAYRRPTWTQALAGFALFAAFALGGLTDAQTKAPTLKPGHEAAPLIAKKATIPAQPQTDAQEQVANEPAKADKGNQPDIARPEKPAGRTIPTSVEGRALDEQGRPIKGATIYLVLVNSSPNKLVAQTETDDNGRYEFRDAPLVSNGANGDFLEDVYFQVFGKAAGRAFAWRGMKELHVDPRYATTPDFLPRDDHLRGFLPGKKIELDLTFPPARPITGRFVDEDGRPIAGVSVWMNNCRRINADNKDEDFDVWGPVLAGKLISEQLHAVSGADGRFELAQSPPNVVSMLSISHSDYASAILHTSTAETPQAKYEEVPIEKLPLEWTLHSVRSVPIVVKLADTGKPLAELGVSAYQEPRSGIRAFAESDQEGKLTLKLPPGKYKLSASPPSTSEYVSTHMDVEVTATPGQQLLTLSIPRGAGLILKATDADSGIPIPGVAFWQQERTSPAGSVLGKRNVALHPSKTSYPKTDDRGEIRAIAQPGTRRYGVGTNGFQLPEGYEPADNADRRFGRELTLESGAEVTVEFKLRKKS